MFDFSTLDELEVQGFQVEEWLPTPLLHRRVFHKQGVCAVDVEILSDC